MVIIKEYVTRNNHDPRVTITTETYAHTYELITSLYETAKLDFPQLAPGDVRIVVYVESPRKYIYGIEFNAKIEDIPAHYEPGLSLKTFA